MREIRGHLEEHYGVAVSSGLMSDVTDAVLGEVREWQNRPLDPVYPVVFFDALRVKNRDEGLVRNKGSTSPWRSPLKATRRCWGCGSSRPRGPSSGSR